MSPVWNRIGTLAVALVVVLSVIAVGAAASPAAADDDPPEVPASYYGEVMINGEPAPEGLVVTAEIDGEERGSIVIEEDGTFGGPTFGDEMLTVEGDSDDEGEPITFLVAGQEVDTGTDVTWESGDVTEVALTGEDIATPFIEIDHPSLVRRRIAVRQ